MEILYDIDVECKRWAAKNGARLETCEMLCDADAFVDCLRSMVRGQGEL